MTRFICRAAAESIDPLGDYMDWIAGDCGRDQVT